LLRIKLFSEYPNIKLVGVFGKTVFYRPNRDVTKPILLPNIKFYADKDFYNLKYISTDYHILNNFMLTKGLKNYTINNYPIKVDSSETNKACIYKIRGLIFVNKKFFKSLNNVEKYVVINHELGHQVFDSEADCDAYAVVKGIGYGYSPYMLFKALKSTLGLHNKGVHKRLSKDFNNIKFYQNGQTN